jgi:uncharacterized protein (DUF885 family)
MTTAVELADALITAALDANPVGATLIGLRDRDDRLADYSEAAEEALATRVRDIAARAEALGPLAGDDEITRAVTIQQAESTLDHLAARAVEYTVVDSFMGPATELLTMLPMIALTEPAHADAYLTRLAGIPEVLATIADRHRAGIAAGRLPVHRLAAANVDFFDRYLAKPDADPLRRPAAPESVDAAAFSAAAFSAAAFNAAAFNAAAFNAERDRLLAEVVRPAVAAYRDALASDVVPYGRPDDRPGLGWLPDGEAIYAGLARAHTTTTRTADELHEIGLDIVAELGTEYRRLGARVFGTDDLDAVFERLRTDPAMRWTGADELLDAARSAITRAEEAAPRWFGRLPATRCTVAAVPEDEAPGAPIAYYMAPALDGSRPGTYFANTYRVQERDRYGSEATAFHEAVPGHHFQLSLSLEMTELPLLRRLASCTAYIEGWGLYSERLADEMGLYTGDVDRFGMLSLDSLRAARLVVDTGLHVKGWSRRQAIDYMVENSPMATVEIESEVDRYISAPGQALAYMVGRLEIQRIRAQAERALGERFDIRAFHDLVLGNGPLPLSVLDGVVTAWSAAG